MSAIRTIGEGREYTSSSVAVKALKRIGKLAQREIDVLPELAQGCSNKDIARWLTLDRLLHHAHIVQIAGESYRLKDKRKAGQVKARTTSR